MNNTIRKKTKSKKGSAMIFSEPKTKRCNWFITESSHQQLSAEAERLGLKPATLIELILINRYQLNQLIPDEQKQKFSPFFKS